jgi:hypothetical protein
VGNLAAVEAPPEVVRVLAEASGQHSSLIYDPRHLERVLQAYIAHYAKERPHRGLDFAVAAGDRAPHVRRTTGTPVERRDVLGGLMHEYRWAA